MLGFSLFILSNYQIHTDSLWIFFNTICFYSTLPLLNIIGDELIPALAIVLNNLWFEYILSSYLHLLKHIVILALIIITFQTI